VAVDSPLGDELTEVSGSHREKPLELGQPHADSADAAEAGDAGPETADSQARLEYYQALRAATDEQESSPEATSQSADTHHRSAWDSIAGSIRPPLDAIRLLPERAAHILDGDATGGGHRHGTGSPGRTEFPAGWNDDTIIDRVLSVARSPDSVELQRNGRWKVMGDRDGVRLDVIVMADGRIWTAYPLPGSPGVTQNPRKL